MFWIFLLWFLVKVTIINGYSWDINQPCQEYIKNLSIAQANLVNCAVANNSPPKVCTNCFDEYINFKQMEYYTHHLDKVFSLDNKTCSTVIYENYIISFASELNNELTNNIWQVSRCHSCLEIEWDFKNANSSISYDNKTLYFNELIDKWRTCVLDFTPYQKNETNSTICTNCDSAFEKLFEYYWKIYTAPDVQFCSDMNDTMNVWHKVFNCPDDTRPADKNHDATVVVFSSIILIVVTGLFYAGSYVQTEVAERHLIQYSQMPFPVRGPRHRLMSSSTNNLNNIPYGTLSDSPSTSLLSST